MDTATLTVAVLAPSVEEIEVVVIFENSQRVVPVVVGAFSIGDGMDRRGNAFTGLEVEWNGNGAVVVETVAFVVLREPE